MKKAMAAMCILGVCGLLSADTTTWRDAQGRVKGTMTTDSYGKTTYRDSMGRIQGTSSTDRYGKTTYRDAMGRVQGTRTSR